MVQSFEFSVPKHSFKHARLKVGILGSVLLCNPTEDKCSGIENLLLILWLKAT